jgi:GNAT superfamily N-acetyltransferase
MDLVIRPATPDDDPAIVRLLAEALGWDDDDRHRRLFAWKHRESPFGPSPGWVALDESGLVGTRTLMRWAFQAGPERLQAVRPVDTATHPRARGRGVFRALTLTAVEELTAEGVDFAFNTPNGQSLPGYLSMGWSLLGRISLSVTISDLRRLARIGRARRRSSGLWSLPTTCGEDAASVIDAADGLCGLSAGWRHDSRIRTVRSVEYLRWRYGSTTVKYRAMLVGRTPEEGLVFFRLRDRGEAVEAVIAESITPPVGHRSLPGAIRRILRESGADYAVTLGRPRTPRSVPAPNSGPLLTWRPLSDRRSCPLQSWDLCAGDVELF